MENRLKTLKNKRNVIGKRISNILSRKHNRANKANMAIGTSNNRIYDKIAKRSSHPTQKLDITLWEGTVGDLRKAKDQPVIHFLTFDPATGSGRGRQLRLTDIIDLVRAEQHRINGTSTYRPENPYELIQFGVDIRSKNPY